MGSPVAIVGGGIVGASIAYHLGERTDQPITVYERADEVATGTTALSNAVFRPTGSPAVRAFKEYGLGLYNEFLADPAADHSSRLAERLDRVELATTVAGAAQLEDRAAEGPGTYCRPEALESSVLAPMLRTETVEGALRFPDAIRFAPRALAVEFVERARASGVEFETGTQVTDVRTDGGRVTGLETSSGAVDADVAISAAGAANTEIAAMVGANLPQRHDIAVLRHVRPTTEFRCTVPNLKHAETGVFYTGRPDGSVVVGRSGGGYEDCSQLDASAVPTAVPDELDRAMARAAENLVPAIGTGSVTVEAEWVGRSCKTPDGHPIIGPMDVDGFAVAAFHSEGIQLAPAAGRLLAGQVVDDPSSLPAADVSPDRFTV